MCKEWDDFKSFHEWAVQSGYDEFAERGAYTLDRMDVNGDCCPENCRWSDMREQTNNRRMTIYVWHDGKKRSLSEWSDITGIKYCTLWKRYKSGKRGDQLFAEVR